MTSKLQHQLARLREQCDGFNDSADKEALQDLERAFGKLPNDVLELYCIHNGSKECPRRGNVWAPARLFPVDEAIETNADCADYLDGMPKVGNVVLLWSDDNSNYLGVYTSGLLTGWLTILDHEEPAMVPAYRNVNAFYERLIATLPGTTSRDFAACDLPTIPRELPLLVDDPMYDDGVLANTFRSLYEREQDEDLRRLYAMCSICLTPVRDTKDVLTFCQDHDMWTPAAAVHLLEFRQFTDGIEELERLALEGCMNGDSAAMRQLVRMDSMSSREVVARLKTKLSGQKLQLLNQWLRLVDRLQPPRWP